jgi:hypothetical protein
MKNGASHFHNSPVNFYKFHAFFSTRLSESRLLQVLRKMGSENGNGCAQNAENGFDFDFLQRYHKDGHEFLNHIIRVTNDDSENTAPALLSACVLWALSSNGRCLQIHCLATGLHAIILCLCVSSARATG